MPSKPTRRREIDASIKYDEVANGFGHATTVAPEPTSALAWLEYTRYSPERAERLARLYPSFFQHEVSSLHDDLASVGSRAQDWFDSIEIPTMCDYALYRAVLAREERWRIISEEHGSSSTTQQ